MCSAPAMRTSCRAINCEEQTHLSEFTASHVWELSGCVASEKQSSRLQLQQAPPKLLCARHAHELPRQNLLKAFLSHRCGDM